MARARGRARGREGSAETRFGGARRGHTSLRSPRGVLRRDASRRGRRARRAVRVGVRAHPRGRANRRGDGAVAGVQGRGRVPRVAHVHRQSGGREGEGRRRRTRRFFARRRPQPVVVPGSRKLGRPADAPRGVAADPGGHSVHARARHRPPRREAREPARRVRGRRREKDEEEAPEGRRSRRRRRRAGRVVRRFEIVHPRAPRRLRVRGGRTRPRVPVRAGGAFRSAADPRVRAA
mmetsp:Transcript_2475/g.9685  ORF Transcript_2475/g.9685 Transcript_2475/m.9685 type:complete len:235 (-) Transcript_2475:644-1348(-)